MALDQQSVERDSSRDWDPRLLALAAMRQKIKPMRLVHFFDHALAFIRPLGA